MLDAVAGIGFSFKNVKYINRVKSINDTYQITITKDIPLTINCLGKVNKTFHMSIFTKEYNKHFNLNDNFGAFRRTLINFFDMVKSNTVNFDPLETIHIMKLLINLKNLKKGESYKFT